jgi:ribosomal protein S18 acetylase RimI-like enzyme
VPLDRLQPYNKKGQQVLLAAPLIESKGVTRATNATAGYHVSGLTPSEFDSHFGTPSSSKSLPAFGFCIYLRAGLECRMVIRDAANSDVLGIAHLHVESWRSAYRGILSDDYLENHAHRDRLAVWQERLSAMAPNPMFVMVAEAGTQLAGFACVFPDEDAVFGSFLDNLHVAPQLTGRGIGRQLLSAAAARLLTSGSRAGLYLWVLEQNHRARRFYKKAGGKFAGSVVSSMPDGQRVVALRFQWPDASRLVL